MIFRCLFLLVFVISFMTKTAFAEFNLFESGQSNAQKSTLSLPSTGVDPSQLLPAKQAFIPELQKASNQRFVIHWKIAHGYYLYQSKIKIKNLDINNLDLPEGEQISDEFFGDQEIYRTDFTMTIDAKQPMSDDFTLEIQAQGCAEVGVCFPPETWKLDVLSVNFSQMNPVVAGVNNADQNEPSTLNKDYVSEQGLLNQKLHNQAFWALPLFVLLGLLLAFTPCVLPMLPILSGLIMDDKNLSPKKGFSLALIYVLSMSITYTILGLAAASLGSGLTAFFQNIYVLSAFALLFVLLALGMFDVIHIQTPLVLQNALNKMFTKHFSNKDGKNGQTTQILKIAVMGILSALIVGPCVAPPLIGILTFIAQSNDLLLGGSALFALSFGMGIPLLVLGASAGQLIPHVGTWMVSVKQFFGFLLLALAIYFLERILRDNIIWLLYATLGLSFTIWLLATRINHQGFAILCKTIAVIIFIFSAQVFWVFFSGILGYSTASFNTDNALSKNARQNFIHIQSREELKKALAQNNGRPFMLDFTADWCVSCKEMEKYTFNTVEVQKAFQAFNVLEVDVTENSEEQRALLSELGLFGPPATLFFTQEGQEIKTHRLFGFIEKEEFLEHLQRVAAY